MSPSIGELEKLQHTKISEGDYLLRKRSTGAPDSLKITVIEVIGGQVGRAIQEQPWLIKGIVKRLPFPELREAIVRRLAPPGLRKVSLMVEPDLGEGLYLPPRLPIYPRGTGESDYTGGLRARRNYVAIIKSEVQEERT